MSAVQVPHPFFRGTSHSRERARQMDVDWGEVVATLVEAEVDYPCPGRYRLLYPTRRIALRGRLAVVYDAGDGAVVTVLWRGEEGRS